MGKGVMYMQTVTKRKVIEFTEEHKYIVESVSFYSPDGESIGSLELLNVCKNEKETFTIWIGDDDLLWFYVCLPTGGEEDEWQVYNLDLFGVPHNHYKDLTWS